MTTKAIEAGARGINQRRKPENTRGSGWASDSELAKACIEAAIASGELVPASAVAAERERCAKVADSFDKSESEWTTDGRVVAQWDCAVEIAAAIRALEPASD